MEIENANSHPFKVAITKDGDKMYANSHPYKVEVVEGGSSTELATELPEIGEEGTTYVLVDDVENPTKVYGTYIYQNGWILVSQPVDQAVQKVTELPETGEEGVLYYLEKEGEEDTYDLYRWINDEWIKVDTDIKLYNSTGTNTDGAMTQNATTSMIFADPSTKYRVQIGATSNASGDSAVAIGRTAYAAQGASAIGMGAYAAGRGSIAFGFGSQANAQGEFNVGTSNIYNGYNNSNYRLLTGLYDGQSAHDAATFGQVVSYSAINGAGVPTTATEGKYVGQLYYDTTNEDMYFLKAIDTTTDPVTYTWEEVGGSAGPTVVQTTGTSTTDVMSQNAVTSMIYDVPAAQLRVKIGNGAITGGLKANAIGDSANASGGNSLAVGADAFAFGSASVAAGWKSSASAQGEFSIGGSSLATGGYNNSQYRLLTNVYDPQSAHDAATKGYVDANSATLLTNTQFNTILEEA